MGHHDTESIASEGKPDFECSARLSARDREIMDASLPNGQGGEESVPVL
jgi:hypothetical protein